MEGGEERGLLVSTGGRMLVWRRRGTAGGGEVDALEGAELLGEVVDGRAGLAGDCVDFHFFCGCGGAVRCGGGWAGCSGRGGLSWVLRAWIDSVRHLQCGTARWGGGTENAGELWCSAAGWRRWWHAPATVIAQPQSWSQPQHETCHILWLYYLRLCGSYGQIILWITKSERDG